MTARLKQTATDMLNFKQFCREIAFDKHDFYRSVFHHHKFQIRNERIAIKRLERICDATFALANRGGFHSMTLRQLSEQCEMSMGGMYAYISSKEELAQLIYSTLNRYCQEQMNRFIDTSEDAAAQLQKTLRYHLYLSELLQPWFYFAYMEARSLNNQIHMAIESEMIMENRITNLIKSGMKEGLFKLTSENPRKIRLNASLIKGMLQDWYLKNGKYQKRRVSVDRYADELIAITFDHLKYEALSADYD